MLFSVRDVDVLRLLCWCQNIRPQDLNSISTKAERENLMALGFIKLHERSGTLTLTGSGRALLDLIFNGAIPSLSLSYHGAAIERRIRLSRLMLSAYRAGIDVFASEVNVARFPLFSLHQLQEREDVIHGAVRELRLLSV